MALLWIDSFDGIGSSGNLGLKYTIANALPSTARFLTGTHSMLLNTTSSSVTSPTLVVSGSSFVIGFGYYFDTGTASATNGAIVSIREGSTAHLTLSFDGAARHLEVSRGTHTGTVLDTTSYVFPQGSWVRLEFKGTIHDSTGSFEVAADDVSVLSGSGLDTRNGGAGVWDNFLHGYTQASNGDALYIDDLYLMDGSGATNNDFLGAWSVRKLKPQTGNGTNTGLTPSSGSDHGAMVDEDTPDGDTTYNEGTSAGQKDTYNFENMPVSGTVFGIQINPLWRKTDAGARTAAIITRSGGTDYAGATQSPPTGYDFQPQIRETDPNTGGAWGISAIDSAEFGVEVVS